MRKWHVIGGAIVLGLGIYGVYDEYFAAVEFIKGLTQPLLAVVGIVMILAGLLAVRFRPAHLIAGLALLGLGIYGFFDEYYATLDFFKGAIPPLLLLGGAVSVVTGVKQLK